MRGFEIVDAMEAISRFLEVLLIIGIGKLCAIAKLLDEEDAKKFNLFVLYVSSSFLIFTSSLGFSFSSIGYLPVAAILLMLSCGLIAYIIGNSLKFEKKTLGSFVLQGMHPNTLYLGFPVVYAFFGDAGLKFATLILIGGHFLVPTAINGIAHYFGRGTALSKSQLLREVLLFPGLIAFALALFISTFSLPVPDTLLNVSKMVGATTIPLTLISLGIFIKLGELRKYWLMTGLVGFMRILVSPLLAFLIAGAFGIDGVARSVLVLEAAMPPALLNISFAAAKGLDLPATYTVTFAVTIISMFTLLATGLLLIG